MTHVLLIEHLFILVACQGHTSSFSQKQKPHPDGQDLFQESMVNRNTDQTKQKKREKITRIRIVKRSPLGTNQNRSEESTQPAWGVFPLFLVFSQIFGCWKFQVSCFQRAACVGLPFRLSCCKIWNSVAINTRFQRKSNGNCVEIKLHFYSNSQ